MLDSTAAASPPPFLKLFQADESAHSGPPGLSPEADLPAFFEAWFLPVAIRGEGKSRGTELQYRETIAWWKQLTADPPLRLIDEFTISSFRDSLAQATYKRGKAGKPRPLSTDRIAIHLRNLRAMLNRIGFKHRPGKATAKILDQVWDVHCPKLHPEPKDCFELEKAQAIVQAAYRTDVPQLAGIEPWQWWRAFLGALYVTDLREGTVRRLERDMLFKKPDGWWLKLPRALVPKTGKGKWMALPDWLMTAIQALPAVGPLIFVASRHKDTLKRDHKHLQSLAGIPFEQQLPLQAWRRTHAREMQRLGAGYAIEVARRSLDHGQSSTTTGHYADITEEIRRRLPPLWEIPNGDTRQKRLFE